MKKLSLRLKSVPALSGDLLVADFHSALVNLATTEVAQAQAKQSEAAITTALQYNSPAQNGVFVTPGDLTPDTQETLLKHSLDAHIKKIQAAQISSFTANQVAQLEAEDRNKYAGKKVRVTVLGDHKDVFVSLWAYSQTGELRKGTFKGRSVTGIIEDVSFERNVLVLRPGLSSRVFLPGRKYILVFVIDMETVAPAVKIQLL